MLDIREIEYWISRYEREADKLEHCVTLSALYSIRDKMLGSGQDDHQISAYSETSKPVVDPLGQYGDSEFLRSVKGKDPVEAWSIMDELMETLKVVNQRVYDSVMRKLELL